MVERYPEEVGVGCSIHPRGTKLVYEPMLNKNTILEVKDLFVSFDGETVFKDVSFSVERGKALAIIGPNGAGKTVLLRALLGLVPYDGEIKWREGIQISYVPQRFSVERSAPISVEEFFLLKSERFWNVTEEFKNHLAHELNSVGLTDDILKKPVGELSGGQLQRILVAWAMLNHPGILLLDEPTSGIDVGGEKTIYDLVRRLQTEHNIAVILISHDLNIVYRYAQQVICLDKKLVCYGPPQEVLNPTELSKLYGGGTFYHHQWKPH
ncbi:MAG: ABC transporter related protein [Parcubacteria group bacterium GW2011_GWB1_45_9]|nr:MAG: ABC transporter related protein [Parcubacteria group bacterium GW2011_GWB1_45_9]